MYRNLYWKSIFFLHSIMRQQIMSRNCGGLTVNPAACNDSVIRHCNIQFNKPVNRYNNTKQWQLYLKAIALLFHDYALPVVLKAKLQPSAEEWDGRLQKECSKIYLSFYLTVHDHFDDWNVLSDKTIYSKNDLFR